MKTKLLIPILGLLLCASPLFTGCGTIAKIQAITTTTVSAQTSDELIKDAEHLTKIAMDTELTFLRLERKHHDAYMAISPNINAFAETLRADKNGNGIQDGIDVLITARVATKSFKENRTPSNEANLRTAWKALQAVIADCEKYSTLVK